MIFLKDKIEEQSFYGCDILKEIKIDKRNHYFINKKGFIFYKNKKEKKKVRLMK